MKHAARAADRHPAGGQAAGGQPAGADGKARGPRLLIQLPYLVVLTGVVAGLLTMRSGAQSVKGGTLVVAGALLAGSCMRLLLPEGRAGMLRSRRRLVDSAVLAILGVGLLVAGLVVRIPG